MWWQILDVSSDADIKEIKRAYARLIKEFRPDTHPSEFGEIRQAFEEARYSVKQRKTYQVDEQQTEEQSIDASEGSSIQEHDSDLTLNPQLNSEVLGYGLDESSAAAKHVCLDGNLGTLDFEDDEEPDHSERYAAMSQLVDEFGDLIYAWKAKEFNDETLLQEILHHDALNQFESYKEVSEKLFSFLVDHIDLAKGPFTTSLNIPYRSLAALDGIFDWSSSEVEILQEYDDENASLVFYGISEGLKKPKLVQRNWSPLKKYSLFLIRAVGYLIAFVFMAANSFGRIFLAIWLSYMVGKAVFRFF